MIRRAGLLAAGAGLALAGCGRQHDEPDGNVVLKAPVASQADIANFTPPAAPSPTLTPRATILAALPPGGTGDAADGSAVAAQEVATRYFAYIAAHRYADAWGLWSDHGKAANLTPEAFAAEFRRYRRYAATVGVPRNPGGGAGQRFIVVPVRIDAIDDTGRPAPLAGTLTLHRVVSGIETGDPSQHLWRINVSAVRPIGQAPGAAAAAGVPARASARYVCGDGFIFRADFDNLADKATLSQGSRALATLDGQRPASGIWYAGSGWELRGKGRGASLTRPGVAATHCRST